MSRSCVELNYENASLEELHSVIRSGGYATQCRCIGIIMLLTGSTRDQVCRAMQIEERSLRKWIHAFNNIHCKTVEELIKRMDESILDLVNNPQNVAQTTTVHFGTDL
jgi:hypothetical protein